MELKKEIFKNFTKIAFNSGLAIATQGQSTIIGSLINSFAGSVLDKFIENKELDKFKKLVQESDPSQLNTDLEKLIIKSLEWSVQNIGFHYQKILSDKNEIRLLNSFTEGLTEELKLLHKTFSSKNISIYNKIEKPTDAEEIFETFDLKVDEFPLINEDHPYNLYFKRHFSNTFQACFGELLKTDANKPAYIAYQKEVYRNVDSNIEKILLQNEQLLKNLSAKEIQEELIQANINWNSIGSNIKKLDLSKITLEFEASFNNKLIELNKKTDILIDLAGNLRDDVSDVKFLTKDISKSLQENWVSKHKVIIYSIIVSLILALLSMIWFNIQSPFQMNLFVSQDKSIQVHPQYPTLSEKAKIRIYLPDENKEKELTSANEVNLTGLKAELKSSSCMIELLDPYWKVTSDSIKLNKGNVQISIRPNETLAKIKGRVLSRNGQNLISNAKIRIENLMDSTKQDGSFLIPVPLEMRRIKYVLRIEKEGYQSLETEYIAGSETEIRLEKIK